MKPEEIRANLNRPVRFTNPRLYIENAEYILTGAVFRLGEQGFYYQAELTDRTTKNSVMIVGLDEIEEVKADA
jgi:hypothetical protein